LVGAALEFLFDNVRELGAKANFHADILLQASYYAHARETALQGLGMGWQ
jgi:hypothetical protein